MVPIPPTEDIAQHRARGAVRAYLEGTRGLDSAIDLIQGANALGNVISGLPHLLP